MRRGFKDMHWTEKNTLMFLLKHLASGVFGGFVFAGLILYFDFGNIWSMISNSSDGWIALYVLFLSLGLTFGSVSMGWGIFSLAEERDDPPDNDYHY